ncbi:MAG: hypothetical protein J6U86_01060 [Clostridia bacterium]|nr:hypothetical protein [Clostridia bacterium]
MKSSNKSNKIVIVTLSLCMAVLAVIVLVIVFFDFWVAKAKLSKIEKSIDNCYEVIITSPLHFDGYSSGAEVVLNARQAEELADDFEDIADDLSFCGTDDGFAGFWDTKITFIVGDKTHSVYVTEKKIYITTEKRAYCFEAKREDKREYDVFYETINSYLDSSRS